MPDRRMALKAAGIAGAASLCSPDSLVGQDAGELPIVDTNAHLFHWPFRRLPLDETPKLLAKMQSLGISSAWVASYEALLHRDLAAVNQRLVDACRRHQELVPVGALNLRLPAWEEDFRLCIERHKMRIVRIYPSYHGYDLASGPIGKLLAMCERRRVLLQIATTMEDTRTQHPLMRKPELDLKPLPTILKSRAAATIQLLNLRLRLPIEPSLADMRGVYFDSARVDATDGLARLAKQLPTRVMLGTHAPLLIPEAALIRVHESGLLKADEMRAVLSGNAHQLLERVGQ